MKSSSEEKLRTSESGNDLLMQLKLRRSSVAPPDTIYFATLRAKSEIIQCGNCTAIFMQCAK